MRRIAGPAAAFGFLLVLVAAGCGNPSDTGEQARQPCGLQAGTPAEAMDETGTEPTEKFREVAVQVGLVITAGDEHQLGDLQEPGCVDAASTAALARVYRGIPVTPVEFHEEFVSVGPSVRYRASCPDGSTREFWLPYNSDGSDLWPNVYQDPPAGSSDTAAPRADASVATPGSALEQETVDPADPRAGTWPTC